MSTVKLTYFKESGKYYSSAEFNVDESSYTHFYQVFDLVENMQRNGDLPELTRGTAWPIILVTSDDHPNSYPGLIFPNLKQEKQFDIDN